ncbi:hypothetical protein HYV30_02230 [Candidatus Kaiserbacteria bacterium]|nr:hypothetical protein [Candidatus Kaiserbacteria bacterium]
MEGRLSDTAQLIMERYALHIDEGGILERALTRLLIGLESPDEFASELHAKLPVSEQTLKDIFTDINQEVFVPLREEERKTGMQEPLKPPAPAPGIPRVQVPPLPTPAAPAPASAGGVSAGEPGHFHLENKLPNHPPVPTQAVIKPVQESTKLLEDHEEPHIDIKLDKTAVPANLPGVVQPVAQTPNVEPIAPTPPVAASNRPSTPAYSLDPYREPIEP